MTNTSKYLKKALKEAKENYLNGFITIEEYLNVQRSVNRLSTFTK